jgi:hypothetical protein
MPQMGDSPRTMLNGISGVTLGESMGGKDEEGGRESRLRTESSNGDL